MILQHIGTIVRRTKSFYYVDVGETKPLLCKIRGRFFSENFQKNKIAVGDEVEVEWSPNNFGLIKTILPRRTILSRRNNGDLEQILASNADTLLMVASIRNPPFRGGLVDRFLVAGSCGGLEPFLILSKTDLVTSKEIKPINDLYSSLGFTVIVTSVYETIGLTKLKNLIQHRTSVLSGHSGVGKSSLISALFPNWGHWPSNLGPKASDWSEIWLPIGKVRPALRKAGRTSQIRPQKRSASRFAQARK